MVAELPVEAVRTGSQRGVSVEHALDPPWARVVCSQREKPGAEVVSQVRKKPHCCLGRFERVTPFIDERRDLEPEAARRGRHELPEAYRARDAHRTGAVATLDHGQVPKRRRQLPRGERGINSRLEPPHALEVVRKPPGGPGLPEFDPLVHLSSEFRVPQHRRTQDLVVESLQVRRDEEVADGLSAHHG
jgi:hypothetical protein